MKARAQVPCAVVLELLSSSILTLKFSDTCALTEQPNVRLSFKEYFSNECKRVADPNPIVNHRFGVSYVMSNTLTGVGTRRPKRGNKHQKGVEAFKGSVFPIRYYSASCKVSECDDFMTKELDNLKTCSINKDRKGVNESVRKLISSPEL